MKQRAPGSPVRKPSLLREALVVKLGGSLSETGELKRWLALITRARRPLIVVPGGGAFADAVRRAPAETDPLELVLGSAPRCTST